MRSSDRGAPAVRRTRRRPPIAKPGGRRLAGVCWPPLPRAARRATARRYGGAAAAPVRHRPARKAARSATGGRAACRACRPMAAPWRSLASRRAGSSVSGCARSIRWCSAAARDRGRAMFPFWSPDSRRRVFAGGKLKKIDITAGRRRHCAPRTRRHVGPRWRDRVPTAAGSAAARTGCRRRPRPLHPTPTGIGRHVSHRSFPTAAMCFLLEGCLEGPTACSWRPLDEGERSDCSRRRVERGVLPHAGSLLFVRQRTLLAQPFDAGRADAQRRSPSP